MQRAMKRFGLVSLAAVVAALAVGVVAASAHGGPGGGAGLGGASVSSLVTQAAKELSVTRSKLVTAIQDAAADRISAAADDGDITSDQADELKAEAQDNLSVAYGVSETKTVASKLGITRGSVRLIMHGTVTEHCDIRQVKEIRNAGQVGNRALR